MSEDSWTGRSRPRLVVANPDDESKSHRPPNGIPLRTTTGPRPSNGIPNTHYQPTAPPQLPYTMNHFPSDFPFQIPPLVSPDKASPSSPPSTPGNSLFKANDRIDPSYPQTPLSNDSGSSNILSYRRPTNSNVRAPIGARPIVKKPPRHSPTTHSAKVIMVTTDSERFVMVDLSAATTAAQMRELILSKLQIFHEDESNPYLIYQTEIGEYAIGEPLSDNRLFTLCREIGDSKGTLKFLLTHPFAPVHEPPPPSQPADYPPAPQPVFPIMPLRTNKGRQSSRSRGGSVSSSSELLTPEMITGTGYEADDDRDTRSIPSQSHLPASPPKRDSPSRRPSIASQPRSGSPDLPPSPMPTVERKSISRKDERQGHSLPPVPMGPPPIPMAPPLSPNRSSFHDDLSPSLTIPDRRHVRSGSDAGADQEYIFRAHDQKIRREHHYPSLQQLRPQDAHEYTSSNRSTRRPYEDADTVQEIILPTGVRSTDEPERSSPTQRRHNQSHYRRPISPFASRNPPRPPPPPMPQSTRVFSNKTRPNILPVGGTPIGHDQVFKSYVMEPRSSRLTNTKQVTKSVGDLKSAGQTSSVRRIPATPNLPILSNPNSRDTTYSPHNSVYSLSKSFDLRNSTRPLPSRLPTGTSPDVIGSSSGQYGTRVMPSTLVSPSYDPYPRPQSAAGETISPTRGYSSRLQSPTVYGSSLDSGDNNRSPRTVSPNRNHHSGFIPGPRPRPTAPSELSSDPSGPENSNTPPLTPQDTQQEERDYVDPSPPLSPRGVLDKDENSGSEPTLKEDKRQYFYDMLSNASSTPTGTLVPSQNVPQSRADELIKQDDSSGSSDDEDSYIGGGTWIVKPETGKSSSAKRPRITVQIETPTNGYVDSTPRQEPSSKDNQLPASRPATSAPNPNLLQVQAKRPESTFIDPDSDNWAPRPPPENIYEELEKFFPKHDLDRPVIEATSGETSPTNAEPVAALPPAPILDEKSRIKAKKSIRYVAQEHRKRIDRTSRAADTILQKDSMLRKRSTKLWGSKLEEVTTLQGRNNSLTSYPESPSGGPTTFKWVRGELIGKGTYGRVYLALNATTGEMIAVKQVELPQTASDKNDSRQHTVVQALKMESETLRDLDHPNIVQYLGFEETPANLSIFLEYVPGGSVGSCLHKHGKFADNVTRSFTAQILSGLEYLHSKGILHRDMKADNILVEMSGVCKISDFGISKRTEDLQGGAFTAMQGTVFWMAPEVVNAQKTGYNFKVDIWSLGCVVLEMWAGMRPWTGEEMVAVMFKLYQSKQPPPVPEDVVLGEEADDFRRKCFAINPEDRPSAAELRKHPYLSLPPGWIFTGFT